jgi:hypothetical protein
MESMEWAVYRQNSGQEIQRRVRPISNPEMPYCISEGMNEPILLYGPLQKPASELQRHSIVLAYLLAGHSPPTL